MCVYGSGFFLWGCTLNYIYRLLKRHKKRFLGGGSIGWTIYIDSRLETQFINICSLIKSSVNLILSNFMKWHHVTCTDLYWWPAGITTTPVDHLSISGLHNKDKAEIKHKVKRSYPVSPCNMLIIYVATKIAQWDDVVLL